MTEPEDQNPEGADARRYRVLKPLLQIGRLDATRWYVWMPAGTDVRDDERPYTIDEAVDRYAEQPA